RVPAVSERRTYTAARDHGVRPARIVPTRGIRPKCLSLTPCFSWVWTRRQWKNRFNGLSHSVEAVERVVTCLDRLFTQLKQGVNERGLSLRCRPYETCGLAINGFVQFHM